MKRALRIHTAVLIALATTTAIACSTATGNTTGGDGRFDAAAPFITSTLDAGQLISGGHTWSELYADYFGNPNRASCAGNGSCHGDETQAGAQDSNFVCPANDKDSCFASLTDPVNELVVAGNPATSALTTQVLRHADGSVGNMPRSPAYGFTTADLQRINDWITAGAPNDSPEDSGTTSTDAVDSGSDASDIGDASDASD